MAESVMRQGMETWLKKECLEVSKKIFYLPRALSSIVDAIFAKEPKGIILENIDVLIDNIDNLKPMITEEQYHHIHSEAIRMKDIVKEKNGKLPYERVSGILDATGSIGKALPVIAGEAITKCQCGKPGGK